MPDKDALAMMYGSDYEQFLSAEESMSGEAGVDEVIQWFDLSSSGTFIDYGCGAGYLLREAAKRGWEAMGVEFDQHVADKYGSEAGVLIVTDPSKLGDECKADILHLGDVIEHLTEPDVQMPRILSLLKKDGVLLAQGPLEANPNLFLTVTRWTRLLRGQRILEMPPYHVIQATADGQRRFFQRFGLKEISFDIHEAAWPAREKLSRCDLRNPRAVLLFLVRRSSQFVSRFRPGVWGNRYFYAGQWIG